MIEQIRRRMMMGGSAKPYDAEVEWIENEYGAYIDTEVYGDNHTDIYANIIPTTYPVQGRDITFGARDNDMWTNPNKSLLININRNNDIYCWKGNYSTRRIGLPYGFVTELALVNFKLTAKNIFGDYSLTIPTNNNFTTLYKLLIFASSDSTGAYKSSPYRLVSFQIVKNNTTVRDFIPVRKNGVGYMYDKVSGQLFGNAGTGQFIIGPDKTA